MYCWARNTYFASFENENLPEVQDRGATMVSYYQWVPFFLVVVAFMFYAPCLLWRILYDKSASRRANVNGLALHLSSVFKHRFRFGETSHPYHHRIFKFLNLRFYEAYLTFLYLGIKLLFLINVLTQMILLSRFLQTNSQGFYGYGILWDLVTGQGWSESPNFPVVTYCDMEIRILGNIQRHTVQCVLVINIFTEKVQQDVFLKKIPSIE
ncbi:innexin-3 domain protein [Oesophagostomum dentatum]|uniref:Innexin n=1 Tax=Oesophagostomum dentatum TaxID=61180 RepID=A0A0B1SLH4_OESDE|nr:innexin-3 domain protein [Oesophagostomum dentatum]